MDLVSNKWTRKVNLVSKFGRRGRNEYKDRSQTRKQLLANERISGLPAAGDQNASSTGRNIHLCQDPTGRQFPRSSSHFI
jgi:hypothetical protein